MTALAGFSAALSIIGGMYCIVAWRAVVRFTLKSSTPPATHPPITLLKPLCGDEPLLEEALISCFAQSYPTFQIVFGCQDREDPALAVVFRLQKRFPNREIAIVVDPKVHGQNRKISNLMNMLPQAHYDLLVISDSDLHLPLNFLERLVAELERPGVGMVTSAYVGMPPPALGWWARLGAAQISHVFFPSVLVSRALGRQDCFGCTVLLRRETLARAGGFRALDHILAEDNVLGRRVRALGLSIGLADAVGATTVPESSLRALWNHELRWMRTIRDTAPLGLAGSLLQYPLFWAMLTCVFSGGAAWSAALLTAVWVIRAAAVNGIDAALEGRVPPRGGARMAWLLPLRDSLSVIEICASYCVENVQWRGNKIRACASPSFADRCHQAARGRAI